MKRGYVQVYTGNGKGKTTAAIGQAVRAAGHGMRTYIGQFMKGCVYGESLALANNALIEIEQYGDSRCIRKDEVTHEHTRQARRGLKRATEKMLSRTFDIVVLDEINVTLWFEILNIDEVLGFLARRPDHVELLLTGRYAPEEILARADLVSEIMEIKHYFRHGVLARDGIER